jgi:methylase of polypeptide subunit release factors
MEFNKKYYEDIWGTVHRHDYCESLASMLISKYGKCSILDIGTGCGFLVNLLREKGCDAWGVDFSEYAVHNACSRKVLLGDIRNLPFQQ